MRLHANARTCPHSRRLIAVRVLEQGWTLAQAAEAAGASVRTAAKWVARYRAEGEGGLVDRSSQPLSSPHRTGEERVEAIASLRRLRMTAAEIAECLRMPFSTVSAVLSRIGLGKLSRLDPLEPANRYEKKLPGELVHIDVKKLVRIETGRSPRHRQPARQPQRDRLGVRARLRRRRDPARLRRGAHRRERPSPPSASCAGPWRTTPPTASRCAALMTDNGPAYISIVHTIACRRSGSDTYALGPTGPAPTAKQNASSAPCSTAGPTAPSTAAPTNADAHSPAGSTTTIAADHTAASATSHP